MALGPRFDLRHSQTLVMTPQLRQAIKLLQYSNIEVATFVERGAGTQSAAGTRRSADAPIGERAAPDQVPSAPTTPPTLRQLTAGRHIAVRDRQPAR